VAVVDCALGPVLAGNLLVADLESQLAIYSRYLDLRPVARGQLSEALATGWDVPALRGASWALLASESGAAWLRLIEDRACVAPAPLSRQGWIALEVLVRDVDELAARLRGGPFRFIGEPADLDVSDSIRAFQVEGSAGEVLYLTQVKSPVPPFDLPLASCEVDRLFIPILAVNERAQALSFYQALPGVTAMSFDTRITVINRALGLPIETRHPIASAQLAGQSLIEIDQLPALRPVTSNGLPGGIAFVSFAVTDLNIVPEQSLGGIYAVEEAPYAGRRAALYRGSGGELVELIETGPR